MPEGIKIPAETDAWASWLRTELSMEATEASGKLLLLAMVEPGFVREVGKAGAGAPAATATRKAPRPIYRKAGKAGGNMMIDDGK